MTIDAPVKPIFGPITVEDMRANEALIRVVFPLVRDACKLSKGRFNETQVFDGLMAGTFKLWGVLRPPADLEAIVVTRVDGSALEIMLLGPDYDDALAFLAPLQAEARARGCKTVRVTGPKFWGREFLTDFDMVACVFEKDLGAR